MPKSTGVDLLGSTPRSTYQSAYRKFHSTETALLRLYNDLLVATDRGQVSGLCLLDLTAAFDTVDHELLLHRLDRTFGVRGHAKEWFKSYLTGRRIALYTAPRRDDLNGYSSNVLRTEGFSFGPAVVYSVYSGPNRPRL